MDKEKLDELWKQVEHIGNVDHFSYDRMVALGSVFGQMRSEIELLNEKVKWLEMTNIELQKHPNTWRL